MQEIRLKMRIALLRAVESVSQPKFLSGDG